MESREICQLSYWNPRQLPIVLQTEMAECGIACLSMIASYWGYNIDISAIRRKFSVSLKGTTLKHLMSMAQKLSLQTRPLKLDVEGMKHLQLPCILHWDMNHFVVLKKVTSSQFHIHDPAIGERRLSISEIAKHFTGVALELTPSASFEKRSEESRPPLRSLMGKVIGLKRGLLQILLLGVALQVCALIAPFYMQWLVDEALVSSDRELISVLGCGFLLLVLVQTCVGAVRNWATTVLSTSLNLQWLRNAFSHLMDLPLSYFEKRHSGDIVSRFASIREIQNNLTTNFVEGIIDGTLVITTLLMMLLYSVKLAVIAFIAVLLYMLLRWFVCKALSEATSEQILHSAKQNTHFLETVRGIQSIRLFGRKDSRQTGWMNALVDQFNADLRIARLSVTYQTGNSLLFGAERVIVIWIAGIAVLDQEFSVGMLFAFISYKDQFSQRMTSLIDKIFEFQMLRLHGERIADIVMSPAESNLMGEEIDAKSFYPSIELRDIKFRYSDEEPDVFNGLTLTIPAGQCVAITGPSGSGKTTLMKILLGLLEPTEGEIYVGGVEIRRFGLKNYRQMVGTVMQDDMMFSGSLSDNISFFDQTPDLDWIKECAQLAAIHAEILSMPMAYNTLVGDIGIGLSGGQKQRILLARALYKRPKILVLDEATSHLDALNEQAVNSAVKNTALTRIVVAHRQETIKMAERVIVLQKGEITQDTLQNINSTPAAA